MEGRSHAVDRRNHRRSVTAQSGTAPFKRQKAQRTLSRKQKGSKSGHPARLDVARVYRKVARTRDDRQWKTAKDLVERFDVLAFETLNLDATKRLWGRKVSDLGFGDFLLKTAWMARKRGKGFVKIYRWEPTTKACRCCGRHQEMALEGRTFACLNSGHTEGRDINAAKNILEAGRRLRTGAGSKTVARRQPALVIAESHGLIPYVKSLFRNQPR